MRFFGLRTCDTCRKALVALHEAGFHPDVIDVRADGVAPADLAAIIAAFGEDAVNRASATWRALTPEERAMPLDALIERHPTVMKRPVIFHDGRWLRGWSPEVRAAFGFG